MEGEKVHRVVYEMSKGSKYFENEERKEAEMKQKIENMRSRCSKLTKADISHYTELAEKRMLELEAARDMTRIWVHVAMDAFYAAVETLNLVRSLRTIHKERETSPPSISISLPIDHRPLVVLSGAVITCDLRPASFVREHTPQRVEMWRSTISGARKSFIRRFGAKPKHPTAGISSQLCFSVQSSLNQSPDFLASVNCVLPPSRRFFSSSPHFDFDASEFPNHGSASSPWTASDLDNGSSSVFGEIDDEIKDVKDISFGDGLPTENASVPLVVEEDAEPGVSIENEENADEGGSVEKVEKMVSLLQSSGLVDGSLESKLEEIGLNVTIDHVMKVLNTQCIPGKKLIEFFSWASRKPGIAVTTSMLETLTKTICAGEIMRDMYALWNLLKDLGEKEIGVLNTDILNSLISFFSRFAKGKVAYEVFNKFGDFACDPNSDTYYFTIEALCRRKIYEWACSACAKMIDAQKFPDACKLGNIISLLCKGKRARDAHLVYVAAKAKGITIPQTSIVSLVKSLCEEAENVHAALEIVQDFPTNERKRAIHSFSLVIQGLCRNKEFQEAKNLLLSMIDAGPPPGNGVFNTIITALSKQGNTMGEAMEVLKMMEGRGLKPDVYTYTVIVSGYVRMSEMEEAYKLFCQAKKKLSPKASKLSLVTYHSLIRGFCKLEQFDRALALFSEMKADGVQPNHDEYNKLIQSLCLYPLDWKKAEELMVEMEANGLHLNAITKGLVRAVKEMEQDAMPKEITAPVQKNQMGVRGTVIV
ncbi:unnamed protein product [Cuscuta campestris]|uniref:Pentacotripeptide-repeat region of PRORP domain-containing protein n=1 Tax=Cuscuta campestris TaxID=132261 RepID=A0A484MDM5_9ASTE|nr:unnamed protein product [Cuscuta campestris]